MEIFSRHFLGRHYTTNPLIGSAATPEVFTVSLDGFDCVTYIETVLALACAGSVNGFSETLRKIRYAGGRIGWPTRNHYMTAWIRNNIRAGILKRVSMRTVSTVAKERVLNVVAGIPARREHIECIPKRVVPGIEGHLQEGDIIFFVSTRANLDVFHAGIIVRSGKKVLLRHASRSRSSVVEQDLAEFLKANRMAGIIVARPKG